jgi:hypothetical protein
MRLRPAQGYCRLKRAKKVIYVNQPAYHALCAMVEAEMF